MDNRESWTALHRTLAVMPNHYPIGALAILMFPTVHRADLQPEDLASALDFGECNPNYLIFHNMKGSGASRPDHVHLQGFFRDEPYAIECTPRTPLLSIGDTIVSRLDRYPVYGLAVKGPQVVDVVFAIKAELQADDPLKPFNLVLTRGETVVIPRSAERPAGFSGAFAGLEMSGGIVLIDEEQYAGLTADDVRRAMSECGVGPWERAALEGRLRRRFAC
jgi:ATP adenylyltransferase/5',5'''-P-1,P-4-tetraphosphate phosphorylase II